MYYCINNICEIINDHNKNLIDESQIDNQQTKNYFVIVEIKKRNV